MGVNRMVFAVATTRWERCCRWMRRLLLLHGSGIFLVTAPSPRGEKIRRPSPKNTLNDGFLPYYFCGQLRIKRTKQNVDMEKGGSSRKWTKLLCSHIFSKWKDDDTERRENIDGSVLWPSFLFQHRMRSATPSRESLTNRMRPLRTRTNLYNHKRITKCRVTWHGQYFNEQRGCLGGGQCI